VCAWENTDGDEAAGASFAHRPRDPAGSCIRGNGEHNIQLLLLTPQGEIFHVLAGYLGPKDLLEELQFALTTFDSLAKTAEEDRDRVVTQAHEKFLDQLEKRSFGGPLGDWEKRRARLDHRFAANHPLLPVESFQPESLVGNGRSFFGSSTNGTPADLLGDPRARELLEKMKGLDLSGPKKVKEPVKGARK
jgi:hypothetical protein